MKRIVSASAGLACLLAALTGLAAAPEAITDPDAPLVKTARDALRQLPGRRPQRR